LEDKGVRAGQAGNDEGFHGSSLAGRDYSEMPTSWYRLVFMSGNRNS